MPIGFAADSKPLSRGKIQQGSSLAACACWLAPCGVFGLPERLRHKIREPTGVNYGISSWSRDADLCRWGHSIFQHRGGFGNNEALKCSFPWFVVVALAGRCRGGTAVGCWRLFCLLQFRLHCQPLLCPQRKYSSSAAINLVGHWMSMLPHPITSRKVLDLQKGGESAAVRIGEVECCFLLRSWLLSAVGPRAKVPRRKQSLLLFCSAREGFDPVCVKTKPRFGTKSLSRMKSRVQKRIPSFEAQLGAC